MRRHTTTTGRRTARLGFLAVLALLAALVEAPPPRPAAEQAAPASASATLDRAAPQSVGGPAGTGEPFAAGAIEAALASLTGPPGLAPVEQPDVPPGDVAMVAAPVHFDAPPQPAAAPPEQLRRGVFDDVVPAGGVWAVIIGINDYPGSRYDLRSAVADANDIDQALAQSGVTPGRRLVLRDREASAGSIRLATEWLVAHAGPDATAVFFFAGHVRKLSGFTEAMVGADGGLVTDAELADALRPLQSRRAWIVMAACYGGGFTEVLAPGRVLTAAADANSLAYENQYFGRSYLVQYMIREAMIEQRAPGSVQQAFSYAEAALGRDYPHRVPIQIDEGSEELVVGEPPPSSDPQGPGGGGTGPAPDGGDDEGEPERDGCSRLTLGVLSCGN